MSRTRSIRPRKAPRSQQVTAIARLLGRPERGLLEAALETPDARQLRERAEAEGVEKTLARAIGVCVEAHEAWQRLPPQTRQQVRGFSVQLLGLAADQALTLERCVAEHEALSAEHARAVARLRDLVPRGELLCAQAKQVLEKVAGAPLREDEQPLIQASSTFALAQRLHRLAYAGQQLLKFTDPSVKKRALLYGVNDAFLDGIAAAGAELVAVNERANATTDLNEMKARLEQARGAAFLLTAQIVEAFTAAHRLDPQVPALQATIAKAPEVRAALMHKPAQPPSRVVVLNVEEPRNAPYEVLPARQAGRRVLPAPIPQVIDLADLDASGVIRKRSKPPQR